MASMEAETSVLQPCAPLETVSPTAAIFSVTASESPLMDADALSCMTLNCSVTPSDIPAIPACADVPIVSHAASMYPLPALRPSATATAAFVPALEAAATAFDMPLSSPLVMPSANASPV